MKKVYVGRQKVLNVNGKIIGYELSFRDHKDGIENKPSNVKATSQILLNSLTYMNFNNIISSNQLAFINVDHKVLDLSVIELLNPEKFIIELLNTTEINEKLVNKITKLHKLGYKIAINDFNCSQSVVNQFKPLLKYISIIKVDMLSVNRNNLKKLIPKFKDMRIKLLADRVETRENYQEYLRMGFDYFQGNFVHKVDVIEADAHAELNHAVILHLITMIKNDEDTEKIEKYIKQRPDLSYHLIKFLNNNNDFENKISSLTQVISYLGRAQLLKWLLIYLFADREGNELSEVLLEKALKRAHQLEELFPKSKEKAFMIGMFSMLGNLFETEIEGLLSELKIEADALLAITEKKGSFGKALLSIENREVEGLKKIVCNNFDQFELIDIIRLLESANIPH